jgi:hypothetical protein
VRVRLGVALRDERGRLSLHRPTAGSRATDPVEVALPGTVSFDDGVRVTYWTTASGLVLRLIMSH